MKGAVKRDRGTDLEVRLILRRRRSALHVHATVTALAESVQATSNRRASVIEQPEVLQMPLEPGKAQRASPSEHETENAATRRQQI